MANVLVKPVKRVLISRAMARRHGMTHAEWLRKRKAGLSNGARKRWIEPPAA